MSRSRDSGFNARGERSVLVRLFEDPLSLTLYQLTCHQPVVAALPQAI
jgi:hypothetical protein